MAEACMYRPMNPGEESVVCELVARVFDEFVGPGYSIEGRQEFLKYVRPDALLDRSRAGHVTLLAIIQGEIVGMIESGSGIRATGLPSRGSRRSAKWH